MSRFDNKVVIITAAASGIGLAAAKRFAAEGATLSLSDIDLAALEKHGAALALPANRLRMRRVDVSRAAETEALVADTVTAFGGLDVLVNNAGVGAFGYVTGITPEAWDRVIATTLSSVFYASRAAMPHLIARRGNIVNTASISGPVADVGFAAYNAAKGGVCNLTRAMAVDHAPDGIRVNAVCPGVTDTGSTAWMRKHPAIMQGFDDRLPMGRMGTPEEMAAAIAFLAFDDASYISGSNLVVDGGLTAGTGQPAFRKLATTTGCTASEGEAHVRLGTQQARRARVFQSVRGRRQSLVGRERLALVQEARSWPALPGHWARGPSAPPRRAARRRA